jgi:hypothetical protein
MVDLRADDRFVRLFYHVIGLLQYLKTCGCFESLYRQSGDMKE